MTTRVEDLPTEVSSAIAAIATDDIPACLRSLVATALDAADLDVDADTAAILAQWRCGAAPTDAAAFTLRVALARTERDAFTHQRHGRTSEHLTQFRRARALDCLVRATAPSPAREQSVHEPAMQERALREQLSECAYEAMMAMGGRDQGAPGVTAIVTEHVS